MKTIVIFLFIYGSGIGWTGLPSKVMEFQTKEECLEAKEAIEARDKDAVAFCKTEIKEATDGTE